MAHACRHLTTRSEAYRGAGSWTSLGANHADLLAGLRERRVHFMCARNNKLHVLVWLYLALSIFLCGTARLTERDLCGHVLLL